MKSINLVLLIFRMNYKNQNHRYSLNEKNMTFDCSLFLKLLRWAKKTEHYKLKKSQYFNFFKWWIYNLQNIQESSI